MKMAMMVDDVFGVFDFFSFWMWLAGTCGWLIDKTASVACSFWTFPSHAYNIVKGLFFLVEADILSLCGW